MLRITKYAQRLIDDLDDVDYIERVKIQQRNWIGRSTGAEVTFKTNIGGEVTVYTTRADYPVRYYLHGHFPRASDAQRVEGQDQKLGRGRGLSEGSREKSDLSAAS